MFKREDRYGKFIGYSLEKDGRYYFFGSRFLPRAALAGTFPDFKFCFLKQVHGKEVVQADPQSTPQADAQITNRQGLALVSQTADCVPILLSSKTKACAIHSGWKGATQNVIASAKLAFEGEPVTFAAIGPHILQQSFEIGRDVARQLFSAAPNGASEYDFMAMHDDPNKVYFDLTELIRQQLRLAFGETLEIAECLEDTKSSVQFHSFRRDREKAERQYSFVVLNS